MTQLGLQARQFDSIFFRLVSFKTTRIPVLCGSTTVILGFPSRQRWIFKIQVYLMCVQYTFEELKQ